MIVKLESNEILQACIEWAERHHGLKLSGEPSVFYTPGVSGSKDADLKIQFTKASGIDAYRTAPAAKDLK